MKPFFDLLPIIVFFIAYKLNGIYLATAFAMGVAALQLMITLLRGQKPEMMHIITIIMITVLGGATLFFHNELFIKWKPTVVYWLLGLVFSASQFIGQKPLVQKMLEKNLMLPKRTWVRLNAFWYSFFFIMGGLNLIVIYAFDTNTWVNFKLFGTLGLTFIFILIQGIMISKMALGEKS